MLATLPLWQRSRDRPRHPVPVQYRIIKMQETTEQNRREKGRTEENSKGKKRTKRNREQNRKWDDEYIGQYQEDEIKVEKNVTNIKMLVLIIKRRMR